MRLKLLSRDEAAGNRVPSRPPDSAGLSESRADPSAVAPGMTRKGKVRRTRASAWWVGLIAAAVVLVALVIFIAQNSASVEVHFLGLQGQVPLAIALVLSAVAGILLVAIPGTARMIQLRSALKKNAGSPGKTPR